MKTFGLHHLQNQLFCIFKNTVIKKIHVLFGLQITLRSVKTFDMNESIYVPMHMKHPTNTRIPT